MSLHIRAERLADQSLIRDLLKRAFGSDIEADLVDALRKEARPIISLVAQDAEEVIGHIMFSPVTLSSAPQRLIMGLAPMAVSPARQRQGVGSALVRAGLGACQQLGATAVVVLGHPTYYPKFNFRPAREFGITSEYDVPDDVFMALELEARALRQTPGIVRYHPAFSRFA
jgi:putative acetyltransferase